MFDTQSPPRRRPLLPAGRHRRPGLGHRPRRRTLHGALRPCRHRHEQPDRLGPAPCRRHLPDRRRLRRTQRRLDGLGLRPHALQAARTAVRPAGAGHAQRRPRRHHARPRPCRPPDGGSDALQPDLGVRLERDPVPGLLRRRRRLSMDHDGTAHESLLQGGGAGDLHLAHRADHRYRLDLCLSRRASGLRYGAAGADVHHHVLLPGAWPSSSSCSRPCMPGTA